MNNSAKERFLESLLSRPNVWTRKISEDQYLTRCPYCGDSSNLSHGHFYIKLNMDTNYAMVYNCVKCPAGGKVTAETCKMLGISDDSIISDVMTFNKSSDMFDGKRIQGEDFSVFDFKLPPIRNSYKLQYISNRLGRWFTEDELVQMKVVTSVYDFLKYNKIQKTTANKTFLDLFERYYIGFLSFGNSHILLRDVTDTMKFSWIKFPIVQESKKNKIFYAMAANINPLSTEPLIINLCEGVMDALSVHFNFTEGQDLTIAVTGGQFESIIVFIIGLGLFGDNVSIHIYADNDADFNDHEVRHSTIGFYREIFKTRKYLFNHVKVFYNQLSKDCGVRREKISLKEYRI